MSGPEYEYDAEFEAYLRRRVRLDRRFRAFDRLEPPAELDRIIIRQAREAIQVPASVPAFRTPKWAAPMALAATLLVSFSLLLDVGLRQAVHHDALSAPMVVEMEFQQGQGPAAESEKSAPVAPNAPSEAPLASPVPRIMHPKVQFARSSNVAARGNSGPPVTERSATERPARESPAGTRESPAGAAAGVATTHAAAGAATEQSATERPARESPAGGMDGSQSGTMSATVNGSAVNASAMPASDPIAARGGEGMEPSRYTGGYAPAPIRLAIASPQMHTVVVIGRRQGMQQVGTFMSDIAAEAVENMRNMAHMRQDPLTIPIPDLPSNLLGGGSGSANPTIRD
jgi:hypothetical protein